MAESRYIIMPPFSQEFWDNMPDWVQYVVMCADMEWIGFENKPIADNDGMWRDVMNGKSVYVYPALAWHETLQKRAG